MPAYPAFALLIASAMQSASERWWSWSLRISGVIFLAAMAAIVGILWTSWSFPAPGDIAQALAQHPEDYTLSLGHMGDLTLRSFAYLRLPLAIAGVATLIGAIGGLLLKRTRAVLALCATMVLFYQAARLALIAFDPYLGSYALAQALNRAQPGGFILDDPYYEMSGIFFYTDRTGLILNGRKNNLEYGSYAPGAPHVFIGDAEFVEHWKGPGRWYVASEDQKVQHLRELVGAGNLHPLVNSGGKTLYVNH